MADEITVLIDGDLNNGNVTNTFSPGSVSIDQTNQNVMDVTLSIGTTEESITFTDFVGDPLVFLYNLDSTNFVQWGLTASYPARLAINDPPTVFRLDNGKTLYLKADTAACKVRIVAYDA